MQRLELSKDVPKKVLRKSEFQVMYANWAGHFTKNHLTDVALNFSDKSLELLPNDHKALMLRSKCKRDNANPKSALKDAERALESTNLFKSAATLEVCDNLYALNEFENNKMALHNGLMLYDGSSIEKSFKQRLIVVDENIKDALGDTLTPFFLENSEHLDKVNDLHKRKLNIDKRPLWKILKEPHKCDVLSILENEEKLLSPRQVMKKKRKTKIFLTTYLKRSWVDVLFLKDLLKNPNLLQHNFKKSTPLVKDLIQTKVKNINTFTKCLHARSPLYTKDKLRFSNRNLHKEHKEAGLFRIQEQTRRTMYMILSHTKKLRNKGKLKDLINFVEQVMSEYVAIKTERIMPWKMDFVYEIYNTLGLAFIDVLKVPTNIDINLPILDIKRTVLRGVNIGTKAPVQFKFGDRNTYQNLESMLEPSGDSKNILARLEKRMIFTKFKIEKCYLYHEIARAHLKQSHFNECVSVASRGVQASLKANLPVWALLTNMLKVRAYCSLGMNNHERRELLSCQEIAKKFKNRTLDRYIGVCLDLNIAASSKHPFLESDASKQSLEAVKSFSYISIISK